MPSAGKLAAALLSGHMAAGAGQAADAADRRAWFESLRMPGSNASCCGLGDCHRTDADWRDGRWWAVVNENWQPVPESTVLASPVSIDGLFSRTVTAVKNVYMMTSHRTNATNQSTDAMRTVLEAVQSRTRVSGVV